VAQAVKPAEPRFLSAFLHGYRTAPEGNVGMTADAAGLTACATKTQKRRREFSPAAEGVSGAG